MSQNTTTHIESPCIRMCCLDDKNICLGCFRSLEEILAWGNANYTERTQILTNAAERRKNASELCSPFRSP